MSAPLSTERLAPSPHLVSAFQIVPQQSLLREAFPDPSGFSHMLPHIFPLSLGIWLSDQFCIICKIIYILSVSFIRVEAPVKERKLNCFLYHFTSHV